MTHTQVFDEILKARGLTYRSYAMKNGQVGNYYYILWNSREIMTDVFVRDLADLGAQVYADNGRIRVPLNAVLGNYPAKNPLWPTLGLIHALGFSLIVVDPIPKYNAEYVVDSVAVTEETKVVRKKGRKPFGE